jgi:hypothetical protein
MNTVQVWKTMRRILWCLMILCLAPSNSLVRGSPNSSRQDQAPLADEKLTVKISADKTTINPGESITVKVEIWNTGSSDVFVAKNIGRYGGDNGYLELLLHYDSKVDGPSIQVAADFGPRTNKPPLVGELSKYWVAIPPGHFYGGEETMDPNSFKRLLVPGVYIIKGSYHSSGFLVRDVFANPLASYVDELKLLPFQAWAGDVETNQISIEVVGPARKSSSDAGQP